MLDQPSSLALLVLIASMADVPAVLCLPTRSPAHVGIHARVHRGRIVRSLAAGRARPNDHGGIAWRCQLVIFGWFALDHYSAGTIAARTTIKKSKRAFFEGDNGVRVWVHQKEHKELDGVRRAVIAHSQPGDWLVCYPYQPATK
jgi:hypothetical protein